MSITAILLAAGYATRLYPLTTDRPKTLLPLGNRTILDEVLSSLDHVRDLRKRVLVTNHRFAPQFHEWQRARHADLDILDDGTDSVESRLGAIRDLELGRKEADPRDDLLVVGTDNLFRWSLDAFVACAQRYRPEPSVALWEAPSTEVATQFGVVERNSSARITNFVEKSPQPPSREVALCIYYFPAAMCQTIRQFIAEGGNADAPGYFIQWLTRRGAVYGILMSGAWYDIGTLEAYQTVLNEWKAESPKGSRR